MKGMDSVLGILRFEEEKIAGEILKLVERRTALRKEKKWADADAVRAELAALGIYVYDTPRGSFWRQR